MTYIIAKNQPGPLPLKIPFDLPISGDVTFAFSGTCSTHFPKSYGGVRVFLDEVLLGEVALYFNNPSEPSALPTHFFPVNLAFGQHTIRLSTLTDETTSDKNDVYSVWIVD